MVNILSFIIRYRKYIAVVLAVLSLVGAFFTYRGVLIAKGYDNGMRECENAKGETINDRIETKQKIDAVMRDSTNDDYLNSLRNGEF